MNDLKLKEIQEGFKNLKIEGCYKHEDISPIFYDVLNIVNPKNILETGSFRGGSAFLWLTLSNANLTSIDPLINTPTEVMLKSTNREHLIEDATPKFNAVDEIRNAFKDRFTFIQKYSKQAHDDKDLAGKEFDLFFVDGDHWEAGITADFEMALDLKVPWVLLDDFNRDVTRVYEQKYKKYYLHPIRHYKSPGTQELLLLKNRVL